MTGCDLTATSSNVFPTQNRVRTDSFKSGERVNSMGIVGHGYNKPRWVRQNFVPPLKPAYTRKIPTLRPVLKCYINTAAFQLLS